MGKNARVIKFSACVVVPGHEILHVLEMLFDSQPMISHYVYERLIS